MYWSMRLSDMNVNRARAAVSGLLDTSRLGNVPQRQATTFDNMRLPSKQMHTVVCTALARRRIRVVLTQLESLRK